MAKDNIEFISEIMTANPDMQVFILFALEGACNVAKYNENELRRELDTIPEVETDVYIDCAKEFLNKLEDFAKYLSNPLNRKPLKTDELLDLYESGRPVYFIDPEKHKADNGSYSINLIDDVTWEVDVIDIDKNIIEDVLFNELTLISSIYK